MHVDKFIHHLQSQQHAFNSIATTITMQDYAAISKRLRLCNPLTSKNHVIQVAYWLQVRPCIL